MAVHSGGQALQRGNLTTPAWERQRPDRLSLRAVILGVGVISLGAWVVIVALLHELG